jgi:tetratricopeptide (TPR) repeat protein
MARIGAFLSYAALDERFVGSVAKKLGRQRALLDSREFATGASFIAEIRRVLANSAMFVLFASESSLESLWVRFEITETEELLREQKLKSALVIVHDRKVSHKDLPPWMQRMRVEHIYAPNAAARLIEQQLREQRGLSPENLFVGREILLSEISAKLIPAEDVLTPHMLLVSGLSGVGRRTFLRRAMQDFLGLRTGPTFKLRQTDGIDTLHLLLMDEVAELDSKENWRIAIEAFTAADDDLKAEMLADMIYGAASGNVGVVIVDEGALLDSSGQYISTFRNVLNSLRKFPDTVVGIVHNRRPSISNDELAEIGACFLRVPPLDTRATRALLAQTLKILEVVNTQDQVSALIPYLDGYPPAVKLAASLAKDYGMSSVVADTSRLKDIQLRAFASTLEKLPLIVLDWAILKLISSGLSLPIDAIAVATDSEEEDVAVSLRKLIDLNLVIPLEQTYSIALPIRFAVQSLQGLLKDEDFARIGRNLKTLYWDNSDVVPSLQIVETTIEALVRTGTDDLADFRGFIVPSMLFRAAKNLAEEGGSDNQRRALDILKQLEIADPNHRTGTVLRAKTEARLGRWSDAETSLKYIRDRNWAEQHSVEGFIAWKRKKFIDAIHAYRKALTLYQGSVDIYHALASCLIRTRDYEEAERVIQGGLKGRRPNTLLIDLAAQIATIRGDYERAAEYVDKLKSLNAVADYNFRMASLLCARHRFNEALPFAREAVKVGKKRYELDATLVDILIGVWQFTEAQEILDRLDHRERYDKEREDIRRGLRCKLHLAQQQWVQAEAHWDLIKEKDLTVHQVLRMHILEQKGSDLTVSPGVRAKSQEEALKIRTHLGTNVADQYLDIGLDDQSEDSEDLNDFQSPHTPEL